MTSREDRLKDIESGRMASAARGFITPFLIERREFYLSRMVNLYRTGTIPHDEIVGYIGAIVALDDLVQHLVSVETHGEVASQQEFGNG